MTEATRIGLLVMAYGGPESLDDLPGYLADIRSGRPVPRNVLEEIRRNYAAIGGRSPLLGHTLRQADALASVLSSFDGPRFHVFVGMRHWTPWIEERVGEMLDLGIERAVSIVMAPHFSTLSIAKYQGRIRDGLAFYRGHIDFAHVDGYHDSPGLIAALCSRVNEGLCSWDSDRRGDVHVVFSAHSLPARIVSAGDSYDRQTMETARLVARAARLPDSRWSWSYQSAGRSSEVWLGPALGDHLHNLAARGIRDVLSVPVGFVSDHVEILYDIDIEARRIASSLDMRLERPPALNDDTVFIADLARIVRARAATAGWL